MSDAAPRRQLYDDLSSAARRLARVPRLARLIGRLPAEKARKLSFTATEADVFWEVYNFDTNDANEERGLLADGLKAKQARRIAWRHDSDPPDDFRTHQIRRACALLGAIAFELLTKTDADRRPAPWWNGVESDLPDFQDRVRDRFVAAGALVDQIGAAEYVGFFDQDWKALLCMDSHRLEHFIFSTGARDDRLRWSDVTTMAFFAAYWACRWERPRELEQTRAWVVDPWDDTNDGFREYWTFAAEMPDEALKVKGVADYRNFVVLFRSLYGPGLLDAEGFPIRSTEFLYRSWDRMRGTPAQRDFLGEFSALRSRQNAAALELHGTFEEIPPGTFQMGALDGEAGATDDERPRHPVTVSAFRMNRHAVTNAQYELFDHGHHRRRGRFGEADESLKPGEDDRRPAVNVSWYDARCFAYWTHNHLPTEAQWEYSCRGGAFDQVFGVGPGNSLSSTQANFEGRYPYGGAAKGDYLQRTRPVRSYEPNAFGLYQMHGNVWEWCEDWYAAGFYETAEGRQRDPVNRAPASARVLRGGCWSDDGRGCRSADRDGGEPGFRAQGCGFRLAAVPVVGAQSGPAGSGAEATPPNGAEA